MLGEEACWKTHTEVCGFLRDATVRLIQEGSDCARVLHVRRPDLCFLRTKCLSHREFPSGKPPKGHAKVEPFDCLVQSLPDVKFPISIVCRTGFAISASILPSRHAEPVRW